MRIEVTFYTCIVIQVGCFESQIINERHFATLDEAQAFQKSLPDNYVSVIASV